MRYSNLLTSLLTITMVGFSVGSAGSEEEYFYCGYSNTDGSAQDYSKWGKGTDFIYSEKNGRWEWITDYTNQYIYEDGIYEQVAKVGFFDDQVGKCDLEMEQIYKEKIREFEELFNK